MIKSWDFFPDKSSVCTLQSFDFYFASSIFCLADPFSVTDHDNFHICKLLHLFVVVAKTSHLCKVGNNFHNDCASGYSLYFISKLYA